VERRSFSDRTKQRRGGEKGFNKRERQKIPLVRSIIHFKKQMNRSERKDQGKREGSDESDLGRQESSPRGK